MRTEQPAAGTPASDHDILRRIAERGLRLAQKQGPDFIDLFQRLLDEIERCDPERNSE